MSNNRILLIINPAAGKEESIRELVDRMFLNCEQKLAIHELSKHEDLGMIVRNSAETADIVAVYGGDGSITTAAAALIGTGRPIAIIPGGTANVLAKELGIPQDTETALQLLRDEQYQLKTIDTGLVNDRPFLLRVNLGIMADMITGTDPDLKDKIGQLAYGVATLKSIQEAQPIDYLLEIDGNKQTVTGVSLTITNSGNIGVGGLELQPGISVSDGLLDVVVLRDAGFLSIIKAAGGSLLGRETDAVGHWTCREVTVTLPQKQQYLRDDSEADADQLTIKIVPASLTVAVPLTD